MANSIRAFHLEFGQALSFGTQLLVLAPNEERVLALVFEQIFHNQTIPGDYQVRRLSWMEFIKQTGLKGILIFIMEKKETILFADGKALPS